MNLKRSFGLVRVINPAELLPVVGGVFWAILGLRDGTFDNTRLVALLCGFGITSLLALYRLLSFMVGALEMLSSLMNFFMKQQEGEGRE